MHLADRYFKAAPELRSERRAAALPAVLVVLATLLALGLRLLELGRHGFSDDEMIVTFIIRQPLAEIYRNVMVNDSHPPLYHMLLRIWTLLLGSDLWTQRLFSAAVGAACVPAAYWLGRVATADRRAALIGAALMAATPFQVLHSQQARMYPLLTLLTTLTAAAFVQAWRKGGWLRWLLVAFCCTAGVYTHIYFWFSLLACDIWALTEAWRARRFDWRSWAGAAIAHAVMLAAFAPFVPTMVGTVRAVIESFWITNTPFDWVLALVSLTTNATVFIRPFSRSVPISLFAVGFPGLLIVLLALFFTARRALRVAEERSGLILLQALIWVPIVVATTISMTVRPILLDRSLIGLSAPLFIIMGRTLSLHWRSRAVRATGLAYSALLVYMLGQLYTAPAYHNDLLNVADRIAAERRPGDAVAYADWQMFDASALAQPALQDVYMLPLKSGENAVWLDRMRVMHTPEPHRSEPVASFAPGYRRVWLVFTLYTLDLDYHRATDLTWLRQHGREITSFETPRSLVYLFEVGQP